MLLTTSTATAPAFCALRILEEKEQIPREINAILPVSEAPGSAVQAVLRAVPEVTTPSGAVRSVFTVAKSPARAANVRVPIFTGVPMKCGTVLAPAVRARAAEPGDSTVK